MCGIIGQIGLENSINRDEVNFTASLNLMEHRGPDDSGVVVEDNYIFGHRRLSILDLSSNARQPMVSNDEKVTLIYNGEIYNFKELKEDLRERGCYFHTTSDTEVLLNGYYCYGIGFINQCIGMFAFALYDKRYNKSYLVRDRLGIKPLYYCNTNGRITFASEIKGILAFENIDKKLNMDAVSSYLSFRYPILDDTFFEGIYSLPPAHYMEIFGNRINTVKYWDPSGKIREQETDRGEEWYLEKLREILNSSIIYRKISDVPIGSLLSGGVDSSLITALMAQESADPIETFTIGYKEDGYNEFNYANKIVEKFKTNHHQIDTNDDAYFETLEELISIKDAPLSIPNEATQYEMCKAIKKHVTVVLAGTGADEIFHGYGRIYRSTWDYERSKDDDFMRNQNGKGIFRENFKNKYGREGFSEEIEHFMCVYNYTGLNLKKKLLNESIDLDDIEGKLVAKVKKQFDEMSSGNYLDRMGNVFLKTHLPGILHHNDISSMAASVELRVPLIDHRLVEFSLTIPKKYKMKWKTDESQVKSNCLMSDEISETYDTPKYLLKKAYENKIPTEILYRKKVGFPVPLHKWLGGGSKSYISTLLLSKKARERNLYNSETLERLLNSHELSNHKGDSRTYQNNMAGKMWMLMNLEIFLNKYFD
jgi:asparagine synthase (glutamine-hydrolysing)